jgi:hypothetical protein
MKNRTTKLAVYLTFFTLAISVAFAGTYTIPAGEGTLTYSVTVTSHQCELHPGDFSTYDTSTYDDFSYTVSGKTTPLTGEDYTDDGSGTGTCLKDYPTITFDVSPGVQIVFTPSGTTGGTAYTSGILYPKYQIQSIIYSTPGNRSSNGFTNSTTDGSITSVGSSFQTGDTITYSLSGGFLGVGSTVSWSYGNSATNGNTTAVTSTISQATGISNASQSSNPNAINHSEDLFIIWINPAVTVLQTGTTTANYSLGTQLQTTGDPDPGSPEIQDQIEVFAQAMQANAQGVTTVPLEALVPQVVDGQTLPGLASICANPTYYPNSCTQANQCGCVPSDFATILAEDPLLKYSSTESPLNADTSGAAACTNPKASASCRYVPIMVANGSDTQVTELLSGPDDPGGNIPVNTFVQTDSTQTAQTYSQSYAYTVNYSWEQMWKPLGTGLSIRSATQFTWTDNETTGAINGTANSMTVTLSSSTVDCYEDIPIFEDTVYHTFVFQQPAGNTSCP